MFEFAAISNDSFATVAITGRCLDVYGNWIVKEQKKKVVAILAEDDFRVIHRIFVRFMRNLKEFSHIVATT